MIPYTSGNITYLNLILYLLHQLRITFPPGILVVIKRDKIHSMRELNESDIRAALPTDKEHLLTHPPGDSWWVPK